MAEKLFVKLAVAAASVAVAMSSDSLYELHATDIHGNDLDLARFNNTVTLVVNVATY